MSLKKKFLKTKNVCKVTFILPKEAVQNAKSVKVVGEFNNWSTTKGVKMKAMKSGSYQAVVELPVGKEYEYRYLINNKEWTNDWEADKYVSSPYGVENSVVVCEN